MSGISTATLVALGGLGAATVGSSVYSARQQSKASDRQEKAAKDAAAKSQEQSGEMAQNFQRKRRMAQGFDAANSMASLVPSGAGGGTLLGA